MRRKLNLASALGISTKKTWDNHAFFRDIKASKKNTAIHCFVFIAFQNNKKKNDPPPQIFFPSGLQ